MKTIFTIHAPKAKHLAKVKAEMIAMGAPTIRVVDCGDYLMALEGCHRIAAAHALGITPNLCVIDQDEIVDVTGFDWFDAANWAESEYQAGEVAGELFSTQAVEYRF